MLKSLDKEWLTPFGTMFIIIGIVLQGVIFSITQDTVLSLISGIAGVISVVLCSERKISMYAFGFIQLFTYIALCFQQNLYGEIVENIFYFVTMIIGLFLWKRNYNNNVNEVDTESLSKKWWIIIAAIGILGSLILSFILKCTNDSLPFLDAFSTVPAFIAQILMILRFKEQWYFWLIVDILTCILWIKADNWCMVAQYVFWTVNCLYGLKNWKIKNI